MEEKFKAGKWKEALKETDRINARFNKMLPELKERLSADVARDFSAMMTDLRKAFMEKNMAEAEAHYIRIQGLFFAIMDNYAYKVPPILSVIDKYVAEAETALRKRNFKRVVSEMNEVYDFSFRAEAFLRSKGVPHGDIEEFRSTVRTVRAAGEEKRAEEARNGLQTLKALSAGFLQLL